MRLSVDPQAVGREVMCIILAIVLVTRRAIPYYLVSNPSDNDSADWERASEPKAILSVSNRAC